MKKPMRDEEETYRAAMVETVIRIEQKVDAVDTKVTYTNGKVRKIILALVLLGGIIIGETFTKQDIIQLLVSHFL